MSSKFLFLEPSNYLDAHCIHNIYLAMWVDSTDLILNQLYFVPSSKPSSNIWLLFIHLGWHLKTWVELYPQHCPHETMLTPTLFTKVLLIATKFTEKVVIFDHKYRGLFTIHIDIDFFLLYEFLPHEGKTMEAPIWY